MTDLRAEYFEERCEAISPFLVRVISYKLGGLYFSTVDNVDPGAIIARSKGATRKEAESQALSRAKDRLLQTRVREVH